MFKKIKKAKDPNDAARATTYVVWLLSRRAYSQKELEDRLKLKGYTQEVAEQVIGRVQELRYQDDEAMARQLVESYKNYRTYGYWMVLQKLKQKKLPEKVIKKALDEVFTVAEEKEVAKRYEAKIQSKLEKLEPKERKQKLYFMLKQRGFR